MDIKKIVTSVTLILIAVGFVKAQESEVYSVNIGSFTDLRVLNCVNVIYSNNPDSIGYAQFRAPANMANAIMFNNNTKGKLTVEVATEYANNPNLPTVYVYSSFLQSVENGGDGIVRVPSVAAAPVMSFKTLANGKIIVNNIDANTVEANVFTGKGVIILDGKCSRASLKLTGTGEIQADKLKATDVFCQIIGTGTIGCYPVSNLTLKGTGPGKVYYVGTPTNIKKTKLIGSVEAVPLKK